MVNCFNCLGHDAIIGRHHQDRNISRFSSSSSHFGKGGVAWSINKGYFTHLALIAGKRKSNLVGTNMLGDAPMFLSNHIALTNGIKQGGFTMVNMS
jgi:hypothetical protein